MSKQEITNQENSLNKVSKSNYMELLTSLDKIIFNLTEENIETSIQQTMKLFDLTFPYSFNTVICNLVFSSFCSQKSLFDKYLNYLLQLQKREEEIDKNIKIIDIFVKCIIKNKTQESYYLIEKMIEQNLIDASITKNIKSKYFAHYKTEKEFNDIFTGFGFKNPFENKFLGNYKEISKNNFELHKKLIKEGVNSNEIAKIIRNDDIEKLQEISSHDNFDFKQQIAPSIYERCDFINQNNVSLIDYAAFFGSVKCFKYLLMNDARLFFTGKYAVAGGNEEIIHLCELNHSSFEGAYETAIKFHHNDIFKYIYDNKLEKLDETNQQSSDGNSCKSPFGSSSFFGNRFQNQTNFGGFGISSMYSRFKSETPTTNINDLRYFCVDSSNFEILSYLEEKEVKINDSIINESAITGNLYLVKHFLINNQIPKNILEFAIGYGNVELIIYLLEQEGIDINATDKDGNTALMFASKNGYTELVELLLKKGANCNEENKIEKETALHLAVEHNRIEIVKILLAQKGIDINPINYVGEGKYEGKTPLHLVVQHNNIKMVKLLLKYPEININASNTNDEWNDEDDYPNTEDEYMCKYYGETPLHLAVKNNNIEIVKLLLEHEEININAKTYKIKGWVKPEYGYGQDWVKYRSIYEGKTPLHIAVKNNNIEIVKLLLAQNNININAMNDFKEHRKFEKEYGGQSPFHLAVKYDNIEIAKLLLEHEGIDVNEKGDYGRKGDNGFVLNFIFKILYFF